MARIACTRTAASGSLAASTTAVNTPRTSASARIASTPYAPSNPSPSSTTNTSGAGAAVSRVISVRVTAAAFFGATLLYLLGPRSWVGSLLESWFGLELAFTWKAAGSNKT